MRVRANLNAKGWTMISEGLEMLEVATAGADVPSLWELFETFFGKVDEDTQSNLSAPLLLLVVTLLPFVQLNERLILLVKTSPKFALLPEMKSQVILVEFINDLFAYIN